MFTFIYPPGFQDNECGGNRIFTFEALLSMNFLLVAIRRAQEIAKCLSLGHKNAGIVNYLCGGEVLRTSASPSVNLGLIPLLSGTRL